jgi:NodT family efflux transporter outer membrane factor (OMF) lipoprotein
MQPSPRDAATALGLLVMLAGLCGCVSLDPQEDAPTPLAVPAHWSEADAAGAGALGVTEASLAQWWQRFDDAQLEGLVRSALQANSSVGVGLAAVQQAQALRDVAAASMWPTLASSASAQRGTAGRNSTGSNFKLGLDANWNIDAFGARRAGMDAGDASAAASLASLGDVRVQIAAEVALNYILLRTAQARRLIADDNLASQQETLQIALWRQQAGLTTALESEQARAAVEQNRALLPALLTSIVQTQHALAVLTGRPPAALRQWLDVPGDQGRVVPQARDGLALGIPGRTLRQRADVRAAEYQVAAALARVGQAQAQRRPSFAIGGSLGLGAATVAALGTGGAVVSSLLASVTLPVFDGDALRAQVRVQQAALGQAQATYRATVLGALQQVEDALVALRGDRMRLASLRLAADAASNAALLARQRYSSGLIDFQTVLDTQRTQFATLDGVASAMADVSSDQVRLFKALGGGWPSADQQGPGGWPSADQQGPGGWPSNLGVQNR